MLKWEMKLRIYSKNEIMGVIKDQVEIIGYAKKIGFIPLIYEDMRLSDLLSFSGNIDDDQIFKNTYLERADLVRSDSLSAIPKIIK